MWRLIKTGQRYQILVIDTRYCVCVGIDTRYIVYAVTNLLQLVIVNILHMTAVGFRDP